MPLGTRLPFSDSADAGVQGPFPRTWTVEILRSVPLIAPARHFTYPHLVPGEEETLARGAMELLVRPRLGGSFLATCALGFSDPAVPSALWSCPAADWLCAVSGGYAYLLDTTDPAHTLQIPLRPVVTIMAAETERLLLFGGFHHVVAWGVGGLRWESARLSWEGLRLGSIRDGRLHGFGWDLFADRELPFALDLETGQHTGGAYLPR